jgi:undecaprenyl-diphosphatase
MNVLFSLDTYFFSLINGLPHTVYLDSFALLLSGYGYQVVLVFICLVLFIREERKDHLFIFQFGLSGLLSWVLQFLLKDIFMRIRPHEIATMIIVGEQPTDFSFPSGHAMIAWAFACVLASKEPRFRLVIYGIAFLISLSRIYLGDHFPSDIIMGGIIGYGIGYVTIFLLNNVILLKNNK